MPLGQKQSRNIITSPTIEETYELGDAILDNDLNEVKKELGDATSFGFIPKSEAKQDFDIADLIRNL
jgi:XTP/dITP diphosphohydrolase